MHVCSPVALLLALLLAGCLAPEPEPDPQLTPEPTPQEGTYDFTDPQVVVGRFAHTVALRQALSHDELGRNLGDESCPQRVEQGGVLALTGGCSAGDVEFEGSLRVTTTDEGDAVTTSYEGTGWRVIALNAPTARVGLDGVAAARVVEDPPGGEWTFEGRVDYLNPSAGVPTDSPTVEGSYRFVGDWIDGEPEHHHFLAELRVEGEGSWEADISLDRIDGPCGDNAPSSWIRLSTGEHEVELLVGADPDPCDFCWPWSLDGVEQAEQACLELP